jgi:uncharacterized membrane protein
MDFAMYTIIGGDGKEYGPVTVDQVRAWMAAGRANHSTRVREVGTEVWRTIAQVPEITGSPSSPGVANPSAPLVAGRAATLDIMSCYRRSWALLTANFWPLFGVSFLITVIHSSISFLLGQWLFYFSAPLASVLGAGLFYYFLLKARGIPAGAGDAFAGFTKGFFNLFAIGFLFSIFIPVGLCLVLVPGVYLFVAYVFAPLLAVDKHLGFWDAMERSRRVVTRNWWRIAGLVLLIFPILAAGVLALGVGVFVAIPIATGAVVYAYRDLCDSGG